jgi:superfamily II DNA/RNA helicase
MPKSPDDYVHRIGRTGRCGETGVAISLIGPKDWPLLARIERATGQKLERQIISGLEPKYESKPRLSDRPTFKSYGRGSNNAGRNSNNSSKGRDGNGNSRAGQPPKKRRFTTSTTAATSGKPNGPNKRAGSSNYVQSDSRNRKPRFARDYTTSDR